MTEDNTGGPAFPGPYANENGNIEVLFKQQGMTLRDYFAAKAMQGWIATFPTDSAVQDVRPYPIALFAYEMADEMLKARSV